MENKKKVNNRIENKNLNKIKKVKTEIQKEKNIKNTKKLNKTRVICFSVVLILIIFLTILVYLAVRPKFKDITIELGTENVSAEDFLVSSIS